MVVCGAWRGCLAQGLEPALATTEDRLWADVAGTGGPLGKLRGIYVVIELGERAWAIEPEKVVHSQRGTAVETSDARLCTVSI